MSVRPCQLTKRQIAKHQITKRQITKRQITRRSQSGMGLVELMVSIAIGIIVMGGVVQVMSTTTSNSRTSFTNNRMQENIRYVINKMTRDANQVGSFGCYSSTLYDSHEKKSVGDILMIENTTSDTELNRYDTSRLISGFDNTGMNETDRVAFRYVSSAGGIPFESYEEYDPTSSTPVGEVITLDLSNEFDRENFIEIEQYDVVLAASCAGAIYFMVTNAPSDSPADVETIELRPGVEAPGSSDNAGQSNREVPAGSGHRVGGVEVLGARLRDYSDEDEEVSVGFWGNANEAGTRPYLYSTSHSNAVIYEIATSMSAEALGEECNEDNPQNCALTRDGEELVEGVEDFQVEYGWNRDGDEDGELVFGDASAIPDDQWNFVDRIRVSLTFNSIDTVRGIGGDNLGRREFTTTIALKNQIRD